MPPPQWSKLSELSLGWRGDWFIFHKVSVSGGLSKVDCPNFLYDGPKKVPLSPNNGACNTLWWFCGLMGVETVTVISVGRIIANLPCIFTWGIGWERRLLGGTMLILLTSYLEISRRGMCRCWALALAGNWSVCSWCHRRLSLRFTPVWCCMGTKLTGSMYSWSKSWRFSSTSLLLPLLSRQDSWFGRPADYPYRCGCFEVVGTNTRLSGLFD